MSEFERKYQIDQPNMVGAEWWRQGVAVKQGSSRRNVLIAAAVGGVGLVGAALAVCGIAASGGDDAPEYTSEDRKALQLQQEYGWSFGAPAENLAGFPSATNAVDKAALSRLADELAPKTSANRPYYSPTLFQAPAALPKTVIPGDSPAKPLADAIVAFETTEMRTAFKRGQAIASLFDQAKGETALVIDLPGPEAVALAAGLARRFDPVFCFDNWPHPRGVVKSHLALAAAAQLQKQLVDAKAVRPDPAPPVFVLDRTRLATYTDQNTQFDNRYWVKLPTAAQLKALGVKQVLYVAPQSTDRLELDDLNADFVAYQQAGVPVKMVAATDFRELGDPKLVKAAERKKLEEAGEWPPYYFAGQPATHEQFWSDYSWTDGTEGTSKPTAKATTAPGYSVTTSDGETYVPTQRATLFSGTGASKIATAVAFGTAAVAIAAGTRAVAGSRYGVRSGSFNRSSGSSGWG